MWALIVEQKIQDLEKHSNIESQRMRERVYKTLGSSHMFPLVQQVTLNEISFVSFSPFCVNYRNNNATFAEFN